MSVTSEGSPRAEEGPPLSFGLYAAALQTHKGGEQSGDCQDAYAWSPPGTSPVRIGVADGVTVSFLPRPWAELLVRHFCDVPPLDVQALPNTPDWEAWLKPVRTQWRQRAEERVAELDSPYYLTNRLAERKPAGATFVGLEFGEPDGAGVPWKGFIIGDTCLFHLRRDRVFRVYPHDDPSRFDNRPAAFLSEGPQQHAPERVDGWAERGDLLVLATDALAKWLLCQPNRQVVADEGAFRMLLDSLDDGAAFESLVNRARREDFRPPMPRLEDDDVTFVVVGCGATLPGMQLLAEFGAALLHDAGEPGRPLPPPAAPLSDPEHVPRPDPEHVPRPDPEHVARPHPEHAGRPDPEHDERTDAEHDLPHSWQASPPRDDPDRTERSRKTLHIEMAVRTNTTKPPRSRVAGWPVGVLIGLLAISLAANTYQALSIEPVPGEDEQVGTSDSTASLTPTSTLTATPAPSGMVGELPDSGNLYENPTGAVVLRFEGASAGHPERWGRFRPEDPRGGREITMQPWVAGFYDGRQNVTPVDGSSIRVKSGVGLRVAPSTKGGTLLGRMVSETPVRIIQVVPDGTNIWYQVEIRGYLRGVPIRAAPRPRPRGRPAERAVHVGDTISRGATTPPVPPATATPPAPPAPQTRPDSTSPASEGSP